MAGYLAERNLPGITVDALAAAQKAAIETSRQSSAAGTPARYIRTTQVPGESRVMCLFEAPSAVDVERLNNQARHPLHARHRSVRSHAPSGDPPKADTNVHL